MAQGGVEPLDHASLRKTRGAFFTPAPVSAFLASWALRSDTDRALEPSCGEASFLLAAAARLRQLKRQARLFDPHNGIPQLVGVEIYAPSAKTASELLSTGGSSLD